jgi:hypothetical protein
VHELVCDAYYQESTVNLELSQWNTGQTSVCLPMHNIYTQNLDRLSCAVHTSFVQQQNKKNLSFASYRSMRTYMDLVCEVQLF